MNSLSTRRRNAYHDGYVVSWIRKSTYVTKRRRGVEVDLFKKGEKADWGNCGGITLLGTVSKTFCKILNDRMGTMMEKEEK